MSAAELAMLLDTMSTSREGRVSNEDRWLVMVMGAVPILVLVLFQEVLYYDAPGCSCPCPPPLLHPSDSAVATRCSTPPLSYPHHLLPSPLHLVTSSPHLTLPLAAQVLHLKREDKKGKKKKPLLSGQKLHLIR